MLKNYCLVAYRTLLRYKGYALLNILGLGLGLTCTVLIFQVLKFQFSFDTYHTKKDRTYRVVTEFSGESTEYQSGVPLPLGQALRNDYSFLEKVAMTYLQYNTLVSVPNSRPFKKFEEEETLTYAEPSYFDILDYQWLAGNPKHALDQPNTVVMTRRMAEKYFGLANPIGKHLRINNDLDLKVNGVLADIPENTDQRQELFVSWATLRGYKNNVAYKLDDWDGVSSRTHCLVLLREGTSQASVEQALQGFVKKYHPDDSQEIRHPLIPLTDFHFSAEYNEQLTVTQLYALASVGLFLLLTACINFVNLATAQALKRSKEVGVRKVMGGTNGQLFWQFIAETGLITLAAIAFAVLMVELLAPVLSQWVHQASDLNLLGTFDLFSDPLLLIFLGVLLIVVTLLAGSYPGLILAGFQPVAALKGKISTQQVGGMSIRRGLVVVQFTLTQLLLIGTLVVTQQMDFFRGKDIGYDPTSIVLVNLPTTDQINLQTLRNRLLQVNGVEQLSFSTTPPTSGNNNRSNHHFDNRQKEEIWDVNTKGGDAQYLQTYGLKLVAGTNLPESDSIRGFLVNEAYAEKLGRQPQEIVGRSLELWGFKAPIVGVVKNWNNLSLQNRIEPVTIFPFPKAYQYVGLKVRSSHLPQTLGGIESVWNETFPDYIYKQSFLDQRIAKAYETEQLMLHLVRVFSFIAIFIGCLGLYGLVSFMAAQKTKEIGVRKVLGASVGQILTLFGTEFGRLILLAFVVAAPLGGWIMTNWLEGYTYKIHLGWQTYAGAMLLTLLVTLCTVSWQSYRAATTNPVKSLKSE